MIAAESYMDLLTDVNHWLFELTLQLIFDVGVGIVVLKVIWPRIRTHFHQDVRHAAGHAATDDPEHDTSPPFVDGPPRHVHKLDPQGKLYSTGPHKRV